MSQIGKNIRKIRMVKKMSQNDFAKLFNVARPSIGAYEEGRAEPKIETVIQIANYFGISIDALLTKEITINELLKFQSIDKKALEKTERTDKDLLTHATPYVTIENQSDYVVQYRNKDFINGLPHLQLPNIPSAKSRAFQVNGSAMQVGNAGINHNDILVCSYIDLENEELTPSEIYVVVHSQGIDHRRLLLNTDQQYDFESDNSSYKRLTIAKGALQEVWKPIFLITGTFEESHSLERRMSELELKFKDLLHKKSK